LILVFQCFTVTEHNVLVVIVLVGNSKRSVWIVHVVVGLPDGESPARGSGGGSRGGGKGFG
jgi:hypothetical protein